MSSGQGHFTVEPRASVSFEADASGTTLTFSCRPYSQPPDLYNSRDSTPSDAIYEIVERSVETMHGTFLSLARVGGHFYGRRSGGYAGEMLENVKSCKFQCHKA